MKFACDGSPDRNRKRVYRAPPVLYPAVKSGRVHTTFSSPLGERLNASVKSQATVHPLVVILSFMRGPFTVIGRVAKIIVDALKRVVCGRTRTHIKDEIREGIPPFTNPYSASAVIMVSTLRWVLTPLTHLLPSVVFRGAGHAVPSEPLALDLLKQASTGKGVAANQGIDGNMFYCSAVAETHPIVRHSSWSPSSRLWARVRERLHNETTIAPSNGRGVIFRGRHDMNLTDRFVLWLGSFGAQTSFEPFVL